MVWTPATPYVQPFGVLHVTYDTYFNHEAAYPIDSGLTIGVLPFKGLQMEVGFDLFYPTYAADEPMSFPVVLNAKLGAPEDVYFDFQPGWSVGIYGVGFEEDVTDANVLHAELGKTLPVGALSIGGYYALNADLYRSADGDEQRAGLMAGYATPGIDLPVIDKLMLAADVQTGKNVAGAVGAGLYVYFTPAIDLLTGPVFFLEPELQPGEAEWMWTMQLDVDLDFVGSAAPPEGAPAAARPRRATASSSSAPAASPKCRSLACPAPRSL